MREFQFYKNFDVPPVSTAEFHADRACVPHFEQPVHRGRFEKTIEYVSRAVQTVYSHKNVSYGDVGVIDLGCGDGGLVAHIDNYMAHTRVFGYDFQPSNVEGWQRRHVWAHTRLLDFVDKWDEVMGAHIYILTEVLEHVSCPHEIVRRIRARNAYVIASSPCNETDQSHDACHAWAWDVEAYRAMFEVAGFVIVRHERVGQFQVLLGAPGVKR